MALPSRLDLIPQCLTIGEGLPPHKLWRRYSSLSCYPINPFMKGGRSLLRQYRGSLQRALQDTFSDTVFQKVDKPASEHFSSRDKPTVMKRSPTIDKDPRTLLNSFAGAQGFDPLDPNNWYSVNPRHLRKYLVCPPRVCWRALTSV